MNLQEFGVLRWDVLSLLLLRLDGLLFLTTFSIVQSFNSGPISSPACPEPWIKNPFSSGSAGSCYLVESKRLKTWSEASASCRRMGANLVALNDVIEAADVASLLLDLDKQTISQTETNAQEWLTSGTLLQNNLWEWSSEGNRFSFSYLQRRHMHGNDNNSNSQHQQQQGGQYLTLKRQFPSTTTTFLTSNDLNRKQKDTNGAIVWSSVTSGQRLPYICEISRHKIGSLLSDLRPVEEYGASGREVLRRERSPVINRHPENRIYFGADGPEPMVIFRCKAQGSPTPVIRWYRGSGGAQVSLRNSKRIWMIGGNLLFIYVNSSDADTYYCTATNRFGTVRSQKASLKLAYMKKFAPSRLDVYATVGEGKVIPCEEPDHFPASLGYGWMFASVKNFVPESDRIFISSRNGGLHFSHLISEDAHSYACNIVQLELQSGRYGPFFKLNLSKKDRFGDSPNFKPKIPPEFPLIVQNMVEIGKKVKLECFAFGRPSPRYRWVRINSSTNPGGKNQTPSDEQQQQQQQIRTNGGRISLDEFNRTLTFEVLTAGDIGLYECVAENELGAERKRIRVQPNSKPQLTSTMINRMIRLGGKVTLDCRVRSEPASSYEWFFNGSPISPLLLPPEDQRRIHITINSLTIENVGYTDAGMYQCVAGNQLGETTSSAYIHVPKTRPNFVKQFEEDRKLFIHPGNSMDIPCHSEANPKPLISWTKNGKPIQKSDQVSQQHDTGSLLISQVRRKHSGHYTCTASSTLGSDSALIVLTMAPHLNLTVKPSRLSLKRGQKLELTCYLRGNNDCGGGSRSCGVLPTFTWTFNGIPIEQLPQFSARSVIPGNRADRDHSSTLYIPYSEIRHSGDYLCRMDSIAGHMSATADVTVSGPPHHPIRVTVNDVKSQSVQLSWLMPKDKAGNYRTGFGGYSIEAWSNFTQQWSTLVPKLKAPHPVVDNYILNKLQPNTRYSFRVSAYNDQGWSKASVPSEKVQTLPSIPLSSVTAVTLHSSHPNQVTVSWKPLTRSEWCSHMMEYLIDYDDTTNGTTTSKVAIGNLDQYEYTIVLDEGEGPMQNAAAMQGESGGGGGGDGRQNGVDFDDGGCQRVAVKVTPLNAEGKGPESQLSQLYFGDRDKAAMKIGKIQTGPLNSTTAYVEWTFDHVLTDEFVDECQSIDAFMIHCSHNSHGGQVPVPSSPIVMAIDREGVERAYRTDRNESDPSTLVYSAVYNVTVSGLQPATRHECWLSIVYNGYRVANRRTGPFTVVTRRRGPTGRIDRVRVDQSYVRSETSVEMEWAKLKNSDSEEPLIGYNVYIHDGSDTDILFVSIQDLYNPSLPLVQIRGLHPFRLYSAQVSAVSLGGESGLSDFVWFRIGDDRMQSIMTAAGTTTTTTATTTGILLKSASNSNQLPSSTTSLSSSSLSAHSSSIHHHHHHHHQGILSFVVLMILIATS